jgi:hypothetical protein
MTTAGEVLDWNKRLTDRIKVITGNSSPDGLNKATDLIESELPEYITKKMRFLATVRNKLAHEINFQEKNIPQNYVQVAREMMTYLDKTYPSASTAAGANRSRSANQTKTGPEYQRPAEPVRLTKKDRYKQTIIAMLLLVSITALEFNLFMVPYIERGYEGRNFFNAILEQTIYVVLIFIPPMLIALIVKTKRVGYFFKQNPAAQIIVGLITGIITILVVIAQSIGLIGNNKSRRY